MTSLHAIPFPNISPVFFELGPLQFRWYGLMYLIGLAGAYFLIMRRVESGGLSMTKDQVIGPRQSDQIHQAVPAKLQGPQLKENRADIGERDRVQPSHLCLMWHIGES